jgi:hypothetical protein
MSNLREAAQQALEVLIRASSYYDTYAEIDALRAALAEEALQRLTDANQEIEAALKEPVAWHAALTRLMPIIEKGVGGLVFTADKAGEVAADMNTLRAASGEG